MKWMLVALAAMGVAGCAVGVREDGSNARQASIKAPISYQEAYRRADSYARHCHTSNNLFITSLNVDGNLFTDTKSAIVHISIPNTGRDTERFEIAADGDGSAVTIVMWDKGMWDDREMAAAKQSIIAGSPVCRSDVTS